MVRFDVAASIAEPQSELHRPPPCAHPLSCGFISRSPLLNTTKNSDVRAALFASSRFLISVSCSTGLVWPLSSGEPASLCALGPMPWQRLNIGSRVTREGHARFWERLGVKVPRATRHLRTKPGTIERQ